MVSYFAVEWPSHSSQWPSQPFPFSRSEVDYLRWWRGWWVSLVMFGHLCIPNQWSPLNSWQKAEFSGNSFHLLPMASILNSTAYSASLLNNSEKLMSLSSGVWSKMHWTKVMKWSLVLIASPPCWHTAVAQSSALFIMRFMNWATLVDLEVPTWLEKYREQCSWKPLH